MYSFNLLRGLKRGLKEARGLKTKPIAIGASPSSLLFPALHVLESPTLYAIKSRFWAGLPYVLQRAAIFFN